MLTCKYNGETIYCNEYVYGNPTEIARKIDELKRLAKERKLLCCDDDCGQPVNFCHGSVRDGYFRHFSGEAARKCGYAKNYEKRKIFDEGKRDLYELFRSRGLTVNVDSIILPKHRTDLCVTFPGGEKVAIEFAKRNTPGLEWSDLHKKYSDMGIPDIWILQDDSIPPYNEKHSHIEFHLMADSINKCIMYYLPKKKTFWVKFLHGLKFEKKHLAKGINDECFFFMTISSLNISADGILNGKFTELKEMEINKVKSVYERREEKEKKEKEEKLKAEKEMAKLRAEKKATYAQTGQYIGARIKGKEQIFTLEQLTANRPAKNLLANYSKKEFEDRVKKIQEYDATSIKMLYYKMCFITSEEMKILLDIYNGLKFTDKEAAVVLEFLMSKAGISY